MESSTIVASAGRAVDAPTVTEALRRTAATHPDIIAVRTPDDTVSLTWSELLGRVDAVAGGFVKLGVGPGDTVAIMLGNRPEFHIVDLAAAMLGATPFSLYVTYPPEEIRYLCTDAACQVAIVEQSYLPLMLEARKGLPDLEHVIVVDRDAQPGTLSLAEVEGSDPDFDVQGAASRIGPDDLLTLIYTSGTTGPPKGVQLSHHNIMVAAKATEQIIPLEPGGRLISWLPAAHIAERMAHHYLPVIYAGSITTCPNPREVLSYLPQVRPTWFFAVPRIWEKLKAGLEAMQAAQPEEQRQPVQAALQAAVERVRRQQRGEPVPAALEAQVTQADEQMFSTLRAMLGLDQAIAVNVGAAPTPVEVLEFFHALGIELAELWGMSETCGFGTCNRPGQVKIGTVGPPSPGAELKLADDGEVLIRGQFVMLGYRNQPREDRGGPRRRRLVAHRRHRVDRRGRLPEDHRPQEGADHQCGRQEHVTGEHRGRTQVGWPADRSGVLHRGRTAVQHGVDRARRRLRAAMGGPAWPRGQDVRGAGRGAEHDRRRSGGDRRSQPAPRPRRADQEVQDPLRRLAARRRRTDPDDEAQAQADCDEVRGQDRNAVLRAGLNSTKHLRARF